MKTVLFFFIYIEIKMARIFLYILAIKNKVIKKLYSECCEVASNSEVIIIRFVDFC